MTQCTRSSTSGLGTALQRSRLISQAQHGANAWIDVGGGADSDDDGPDREFQWAMRYRVGSELLQQEDLGTACRCLISLMRRQTGGDSAVSQTHMSSCKYYYGVGATESSGTTLSCSRLMTCFGPPLLPRLSFVFRDDHVCPGPAGGSVFPMAPFLCCPVSVFTLCCWLLTFCHWH